MTQIEENRKRWVEGLRSGSYPQTAGKLYRQHAEGEDRAGYCCLGVACDVLGVDKTGGDGDSSYAELERLLGMSRDQSRTAYWMNDNQHESFGAIADWIEGGMTPRWGL